MARSRVFFLSLMGALSACGPTGGPDLQDIAGADGGPQTDALSSDGRSAEDATLPTGDGGTDGPPAVACNALPAVIRDFSVSHPDFEDFGGDVAYTGLVKSELGSDDKPVYAHPGATAQTTGPTEFAQWYHDTPGINMSFEVTLALTETSPGLFVYDNPEFFPIDGKGFGNEGNPNNFHFTTELHTSFHYRGGEVFTFTGDDDIWIFINRKLAIDLGGLHSTLSQTVNLDAAAASLGLVPGNAYGLDIFHAERHTTASRFRIETTIDCFVIE